MRAPEEQIRKKGGRLTKQRVYILSYLNGVSSHPTAETVYKEVRRKLPHISLGTVYRNLNYLVESGLALQIKTPDAKSHFDGNTKHHLHYICRRCGTVYDIQNTKVIGFNKLKYGHVDKVECSLYGICKECEK